MKLTQSREVKIVNIVQKIRRAVILVSFLLFPITIYYFSPHLIIDGAANGIITGSLIMFAVLFLISLVFGRAFCGWACPGAGIQEWCFSVNKKKSRGGKLNWIKYFIWVPWLIIILIAAISAGGFHTVNPLYYTEHGISVSEPSAYIIYFSVVGIFVILSFTLGKRAVCHYVCWMAPFMIIGTKIKNFFKWPSLHLEVAPDKCKQCKICDDNCPMSLEVSKMVKSGSIKSSECILCGNCICSCPNGVIKYSWGYRR